MMAAKAAKKVQQKAPTKKLAVKTTATKPKAAAEKKVAKTKAAAPASKKVTTAPKKVAVTATSKKVATPVKETKAVKVAKVETPVVVAKTVAKAAPVAAKPTLPVRQASMAPVPQRPNSPFSANRPGQQPQRQIITTAPKAPLNDNGAAVSFKVGDAVVYPAHGVGVVENIETQTIAGMDVQLYAIRFEKDRMCLKIPVFKAKSSGLRKLCSTDRLKDAMKTLQGRAKIKRTMWSRRAQEYEMKINSGDPVSIAEVLRDLKRSNDDHEQSYSERQIYQSALERLAREVAAVQKITELQAAEQLEKMLGKLAAA
jgi:CarD family transcriptional regulator